ncbi:MULTISPECIES: hypothetical protein [unclassified Egicoccus]|uniref:hypothetical protein n=1 Tax=unclassified Egicoccus TaxID=2635606 RepID=UPI00359E8078
MRSYTLEIPDMPVWNANSRGHHHERARKVRSWRDAVAWIAAADGIPALDLVEIELVMIPADRRRRDVDNIAGVLKPCIDGLRDAGVLIEDDARHVRAVTCRIAQPQPALTRHRWLLTVRQLTAADEGEAA